VEDFWRDFWPETGQTVRAALTSGPATARLCVLIAVATAAACVLAVFWH